MAKLELAAAIAVICFAAFVWIALPGFFLDPMIGNGTIGAATAVFGILGVAVGLVWMIRIYRADPEPDPRAWRYRDRD